MVIPTLTYFRQLWISKIPESVTIQESLSSTWVSTSTESFSESDQTRSYTDDVTDFESWNSRQTDLKENIKKVCDKYGKSLSHKVPLNAFMYDSKHKLLFCRNAKVNVELICRFLFCVGQTYRHTVLHSRFIVLLTPALLFHKEQAQGTQSPLPFAGFLWLQCT